MKYILVNPVGSKFAKALQLGLAAQGIRALRTTPERFRILNRRGRHQAFNVTAGTLNKIQQLTAFKANNVSCPDFTTEVERVADLPSKVVFARTVINGTNGRGIVEFERGSLPPDAPLYVAYIPKRHEFRVHVFNGKVIDVQQKRKKREFEGERDTRVRNCNNGYVYTRSNLVEPADLRQLAIDAVKACNYGYGSCDIIYNEKQDKCFVLEVNSRPGLMGTTLINYTNALKEFYGNA